MQKNHPFNIKIDRVMIFAENRYIWPTVHSTMAQKEKKNGNNYSSFENICMIYQNRGFQVCRIQFWWENYVSAALTGLTSSWLQKGLSHSTSIGFSNENYIDRLDHQFKIFNLCTVSFDIYIYTYIKHIKKIMQV